jgi:hypothetical protein
MGSVKILLFDFDVFLKNVYLWRCHWQVQKLNLCHFSTPSSAIPNFANWVYRQFKKLQSVKVGELIYYHHKIFKNVGVIFLVSKNVTISAFDDRSVKVRT